MREYIAIFTYSYYGTYTQEIVVYGKLDMNIVACSF